MAIVNSYDKLPQGTVTPVYCLHSGDLYWFIVACLHSHQMLTFRWLGAAGRINSSVNFAAIPNLNLRKKRRRPSIPEPTSMEPSSIPYLRDSSQWLSPDIEVDIEMHHVGIHEDRYLKYYWKIALASGFWKIQLSNIHGNRETYNRMPSCILQTSGVLSNRKHLLGVDCNPHKLEGCLWFSGIMLNPPSLFQRRPQKLVSACCYKDVS